VNCWLAPTAIEGDAGPTAIEVNVGVDAGGVPLPPPQAVSEASNASDIIWAVFITSLMTTKVKRHSLPLYALKAARGKKASGESRYSIPK